MLTIWRILSLKDIFPGELLALCVQDKDVGPEEDLGGWRAGDAEPSPGQAAIGEATHQSKEMANLPGGLVGKSHETVPLQAGAQGSRVPLWPLRLLRGAPAMSVEVITRGERRASTSMLNPPPPPSAGGTESRHTGRVRSRPSWERGRQQARPGSWVRLPERQFPAMSEVGRWARERLRCSEWDAWLRNLRACLPRSPPGLLERCLIQFLDWGVEAARDLRQPDFLPLITAAPSALDSGVWESLLHDSASPKLLMQRMREEVLRNSLGVVGHIPIPADIWERYVPESFASAASRHFSRVGPPSYDAVVMLHALRSQNLLFPLPPRSPGPNWGVFAIPKTLDKCSVIVNLVPVNREMPEKPEKFSLPSVEVLALLAQVAQHVHRFPRPPSMVRHGASGRSGRCRGSRGGGGGEALCVCHIDLSTCFWSLRLPETFWGAFRIPDVEGGVLSFMCLPFGWKYSPVLCQKVLERLVEEIGVVVVLVLIYINDVLILSA